MNEDLKKIYEYIPTPTKFDLDYQESNKIQSLYGEVTEPGASDLITGLRERELLKKKSKFVDVGSGYGRLVLHMAMVDEITESYGIEYLASKLNQSIGLLKSLSQDFPKDKVRLEVKDILDVKFLDYDIIFHNSISWTKEHIQHLVNVSKRDSIHISTTDVALRHRNLEIERLESFYLNTSWRKNGKKTEWYVYRKL